MKDKAKYNIAKELRKNTKNIFLQEFIDDYLSGFYPRINDDYTIEQDFQLLKFHLCIAYIEKENFDVSGWCVYEIPHEDVFWFLKEGKTHEEAQWFHLIYNWFKNYEIRPSYLDKNAEDIEANSIEEAVSLHAIF